MKLSELQADLESVRKQLVEKYGTEVESRLTLNPEDISVVMMTLALKTTKSTAIVDVTPEVAPEATSGESQG